MTEATKVRMVSDITGKTVKLADTLIGDQTLEQYFADNGLVPPTGSQSVIGASGTRYAPGAVVPTEDTLIVIDQIRNG